MSIAMTPAAGRGELVPFGAGPTATVFVGADAWTGVPFVLKVYPGRIDRRGRSALEAELGRLARLRTQAAVLVADRVEELADGRCALRTELCAQSLPELMSGTAALSVPDGIAIGHALARTLAAAHSAGLVHGGVTPGNVLFRPSGEPVLADFGRTIRQLFPPNTRYGVEYLAPETVRDGSRDQRTDLYGLGAVLYLALSGTPPHRGRPGEAPEELVLRVLSTSPALLERSDAPAELAELVATLLASSPDARPASAATVADRLGALLGPGTAAQPFDDFGGLIAPPTQWPRRPPPVQQAPVQQAPAPHIPAQPTPAGPPQAVPAPQPRGQLLLEYGPQARTRSTPATGVLLAVVGALSVLAVAVVVLLLSQPAGLDPQDASGPGGAAGRDGRQPAAAPIRIELNDPVDAGSHVELSWRSNQALDFAVIVTPEGGNTDTVLARRNTEFRVPVDPDKRYCFLIQGATSQQIVESQAKPIRGATCTK